MANQFEGGGISQPPRHSGGGSFGATGRPNGHPSQRRRPKPSGHPSQRRRPAPQSSSRREPRNSSGGQGVSGGYGSYGGGSIGASSLGSVAPVAPPAPDINTFLAGDDTYQTQLGALAKALSNYKTQMGERQTEYNTDFTNRMNELNKTEQRSTTEQADDYAGRGMFISGLYGKARSDLEGDFDRRETDMNTTRTSWLNALNRDFLNFSEEQGLSRGKARQEALDRRIAQYGL